MTYNEINEEIRISSHGEKYVGFIYEVINTKTGEKTQAYVKRVQPGHPFNDVLFDSLDDMNIWSDDWDWVRKY